MRREKDRQDGQSLVELALVLPLLLMVLVGMVEVGWAMRAHLVVTNATREGARFAARRVFDYGEIEEVTHVAMLALNPIFDGPDANATFIITKVFIDPDGTWEIEGGEPYITGTLPVSTRLDSAFYQQLADENAIFNAAHPEFGGSEDNVVIVEVFYDHELLLGTRMAGRMAIGLGPMRMYSRGMNRIGISRYE